MNCRGHQRYVVDHTLLSPSGRTSKRARAAAEAREAERMRACAARDAEARAACPLCSARRLTAEAQRRETKRATMREQARNLRRLAALGMKPKAHRALADKLEAEAAALEA